MPEALNLAATVTGGGRAGLRLRLQGPLAVLLAGEAWRARPDDDSSPWTGLAASAGLAWIP